MKYFGFCDPSGGGSDSMTLGVARMSWPASRLAILAGAWERKPPFSPDQVVEEFASTLHYYRISTVVGDRYSGQWVSERFREHGVTYTASVKTKSEIFLEFLALVNSGRVRIPNDKLLRTQLVALERRTSRSGKDTVDHAQGSHDDFCNAAAGALVLAAGAAHAQREPIFEVLETPRGWTPTGASCEESRFRWLKLN